MIGFVYAIESDGLVKIGYSTNPKRRLNTIRVNRVSHCELLGYVEATRKQEAECHELLKSEHKRGEWFSKGPLVSLFISKMSIPE